MKREIFSWTLPSASPRKEFVSLYTMRNVFAPASSDLFAVKEIEDCVQGERKDETHKGPEGHKYAKDKKKDNIDDNAVSIYP